MFSSANFPLVVGNDLQYFTVCNINDKSHLFQNFGPKNFQKYPDSKSGLISHFDQALLLFLEAFWSALGLALVPFHGGLRADPVALLLGVSAKVCAPTDFLASSYSNLSGPKGEDDFEPKTLI